MVSLLAKLWIKDKDNVSSPAVRQAYGILCGAVGILLNILLFAGKFFAGSISNSIAITADAFNNLSDAGSSIITLIGFKLAGQKPDPHHPFGHGRLEYITGLIVSGIILIMAFELLQSSVQKILHPEIASFNLLSVAVLIASIAVKAYMYLYNHRIGKRLDSAAMLATASDSLSDTMATIVVLVSAIFYQFTHINVDGYCGVLVGLFILYAGISAARETMNPLLGQPPEKEYVQAIHDLVMSNDKVLGIHDLIVHDYGPGRIMISLHAEVSSDENFLEIHDIIDNIERSLSQSLGCEAVIHMDPVMLNDNLTKTTQEETLKIVKNIDPALTIHDFRIVKGPTHTNLIFDTVAPMDFPMSDQELSEIIASEIKKYNPSYFAVIQVDKSYLQ